MKKIGLLTTLLVAGLLLSGCFEKVQDCIGGEAACTRESKIEEPEISLIDQLKQSFTGNLINGRVDESLLTNKPNSIYFDITGDNTLYYIDEFGLAFTLGEEWKGGKIENAYEGKYLASVRIRNEGIKTYGIFIIDNTTYQRVKDSLSNDEDETIGYNNQYTFQRRIVDNGDKLGEYNLILYEVDNEKHNLYNQPLEDITKSKAQPQRINDYPEEVSEETNSDMPVAKMRVLEGQTEEETQAMVEEACSNMGGNWVDGGCVLEDGSIVNF